MRGRHISIRRSFARSSETIYRRVKYFIETGILMIAQTNDNQEESIIPLLRHLGDHQITNMSNIETIYQYCSINTFHSMMKNKEIWASHYDAMNDTQEMVWIEKYIKSFYDKNKDIKTHSAFAKEEFIKSYSPYRYLAFLSCFSSDRDMLSQWRGYANQGTGFAVGFNTKKIKDIIETLSTQNKQIALFQLGKVLYDRRQQEGLVHTELKCAAEGNNPSDVQSRLSSLAPFYKNPAFEEEKETRIVVSVKKDTSTLSQLKGVSIESRTASNSITTYLPIKFPIEAITHITLGPQNTTDIFQLETFLTMNGYDKDKIKIEHSMASYKSY